jgi:ATP-dependent HslUV protease ATP-binding subunit HslU
MVKAASAGEVATGSDAGKALPLLIERVTEKGTERVLRVEREYVQQQVADIVKNQDLSRYIL